MADNWAGAYSVSSEEMYQDYEQGARKENQLATGSGFVLESGRDGAASKGAADTQTVRERCPRCWWCLTVTIVVCMGLATLLTLGASWSHKPNPDSYANPSHRVGFYLPRTVLPTHYDVNMRVSIDSARAWGWVNMTLDVTTSTQRIVFHAHSSVSVTSAVLFAPNDPLFEHPIHPHLIYRLPEYDYVQLDMQHLVQPGSGYVLHVMFSERLQDTELSGLYLSHYEHEGMTHTIAATQFEPTDARRMIPCFDEPSFKATFAMTISAPEELTVLYNTDPISADPDPEFPGFTVRTFEHTPRMATYLLAVVIGDLESAEMASNYGVTVRVFTPRGLIDQAQFALNTAADALSVYDLFFRVPYPLPKVDLVAIPDFAAGAMENWGLITFRYSAMLVDSDEGTNREKRRVALVVCHELAHQWFGNLVTMYNFGDLWLNEGFASYMQYIGMDDLYPQWQVWDSFPLDEQFYAMFEDATPSTHAVAIPTDDMDPSLIPQLFDAISYGKGASLIRMLYEYLRLLPSVGEDGFQLALADYLQAHQYANARTSDLWQAFESSTKVSGIVRMMEGWGSQKGFPVVNVEVVSSPGQQLRVKLTQEPFTSAPYGNEAEGDAFARQLWSVPLQIALVDDGAEEDLHGVMLSSKSQTFTIDATGDDDGDDFVLVNAGHGSYVRANYTHEAWMHIVATLQQTPLVLATSDRAGIIDDSYAMMWASQLFYTIPLELTKAAEGETTYPVWAAMVRHLWLLVEKASTDNDLVAVKEWVRARLTSPLALVGTGFEFSPPSPTDPDDGGSAELLRSLIVHMAAFVEDPQVIANAAAAYNAYNSSALGTVIQPSLLQVAFDTHVAYGGDGVYDTMHGHFLNAHNSGNTEEAILTFNALCAATTQARLSQTLQLLVTNDGSGAPYVRVQDFPSMLVRVARNPHGGRQLAFSFLQDYWSLVMDRYGDGGFALGRIIEGVCGLFDTQDQLDEVTEFFSQNPVENASGAVARTLEIIQRNVIWRQANYDQVMAYVRTN